MYGYDEAAVDLCLVLIASSGLQLETFLGYDYSVGRVPGMNQRICLALKTRLLREVMESTFLWADSCFLIFSEVITLIY